MSMQPLARWLMALALVGAAALAPPSRVAGADGDLEALEREVGQLRERAEEDRRKLEVLERKLEQLQAAPAAEPAATTPATALEQVLAEAGRDVRPAKRDDLWSAKLGGAELRLIDVSFDVMVAGGTSTERTDSLQNLQGGAHDPLRRGFTFQQGEFSLIGAVDPYFTAEAHVIYFPEGVEFEEGFFQTTSLPYGLQVEGGHFFTEFGLINPLHPHAWDWLDQPVVNSRMFGGDGTRGPGFRVGWLAPLPWFSEVHYGMQNATEGGFTPSFVGSRIGGRPAVDRDVRDLGDLLHLVRWQNAWDFSDEVSASVGASGLFGPNHTGPDGQTFVYGADLRVRWRPLRNFRGWPYLVWQTEVIKRDYTADWFVAGTESSSGGDDCHGGHCHGEGDEEDDVDEFPNDLPGDILRDVGMYTQLVYGFRYGWSAGLRYEYASGRGQSVIDGVLASRQDDPGRDDRHRLSPLLIWQPTHFSRFRLQYNYDHAKHLAARDAHTVWLGAEVFYGAHPAHGF